MEKVITIGRSKQSDIVIDDHECIVSSNHATVSIVNGKYWFVDNSRNGTLINGRLLKKQGTEVDTSCEILLAGKIALPWQKIIGILPLEKPTKTVNIVQPDYNQLQEIDNGKLGVGWAILTSLVPLTGWFLYAAWINIALQKAKEASRNAWIAVAVGIISILLAE